MMDLGNLPEVTFAQKDVSSILDDMISGYEAVYLEQTGTAITLYPGDPVRIYLYSQALREFQLRQLIDFSAKQNLLKYASGDYLENIGAPFVERLQPQYATVTEQFTLSAAQTVIQTIPKGTRCSSASNIYFATTEDVEIPVGSTSVSIVLTCNAAGSSGNNFSPGQINILVDPLPWIKSVSNVSTSQGGSDIESDDNLRERIYEAPEGFSTAGPEGAYIFFVKQYNQAVSDVKISSPSAGQVDIRVLLANGEIPDGTFLSGIEDYLNDNNKRPLTDSLTIAAPDVVNYDINLKYYISLDNAISASTIQASVNQAVQDYITWQKTKIGRDINTSELITKIISAGAKRVEITSPTYTVITDNQVAIASANVSITYGGLEDD